MLTPHAAARDAAQAYPKAGQAGHPLHPRGARDLLTSHGRAKLGEYWGQPVVVENKPGGGSSIGTLAGSRAAPTVHAADDRARTADRAAGDPEDAAVQRTDRFRADYPLVRTPWALYINPSLPVNNFKEFVSTPGRIRQLNGDRRDGQFQPSANAVIAMRTGAKFENIHYRGSAPIPT
jgi:tripartite-type tricarboxylate transporter receptor subunit TctC